jgi:hypothetical protein
MEDADIVKIVVKQATNDETIPLLLINVDDISDGLDIIGPRVTEHKEQTFAPVTDMVLTDDRIFDADGGSAFVELLNQCLAVKKLEIGSLDILIGNQFAEGLKIAIYCSGFLLLHHEIQGTPAFATSVLGKVQMEGS